MRLVLLLPIALAAIPLNASAQVINACVKPNGNLRVVPDPTACGNSETPLSWNAQGPPGTPGEPGMDGEPGPQGPPGAELTVFDGAGEPVGLFMSMAAGVPGLLWIFLEDLGVSMAVVTGPNGNRIGNIYHGAFWYTEPNCAGDPFIIELRQAGYVFQTEGDRLFVAGTTGQMLELRSNGDPSVGCTNPEFSPPVSELAIAVTETTEEALGFPRPDPLYVGVSPE